MKAPGNAGLVVDTSVLSALFAGRAPASVRTTTNDIQLYLSPIVIGEALRGAYSAAWGGRRVGSLLEYINRRYAVLNIDGMIAAEWAALVATCMERGHTPGANDAWIAATAVVHGLPVVTIDADFATMACHYPALRVLP